MFTLSTTRRTPIILLEEALSFQEEELTAVQSIIKEPD
jgi:hypothetical protein